MNFINQLVKCLSIVLFFIILSNHKSIAQNVGTEVKLNSAQIHALELLNKVDTTATSAYFPNIKPHLFFNNIRQNILYPDKINQGKRTNFCGYAAVTHVLVKFQPEIYLKLILLLYRNGKVSYNKKIMKPSERVSMVAGMLKYKGILDIHHADQLWFLALADNFKGYVNIFNRKYNFGDENRVWAGTNFHKFNTMLKELGIYKIDAVGSDLIAPMKSNYYNYISSCNKKGIVLLYICGKFLHPISHALIKLKVPSHFIVLYDITKDADGMIELKYWDYGLKTVLRVNEEKLHKAIFGITLLTKE